LVAIRSFEFKFFIPGNHYRLDLYNFSVKRFGIEKNLADRVSVCAGKKDGVLRYAPITIRNGTNFIVLSPPTESGR
jgi:hypothetical protein